MSAEYSVEEVRVVADAIEFRGGAFSPVAVAMLRAYAARIKADEGAVPALVYLGCNNGAPMYQWNCRWNELEAGTEFYTNPPAQAAQVDACYHQCKRIHPHCQLRLTRDIWPDVNWHWGVTMPDGHLYDNSHGPMSFEKALADMQTRGVTALDAADIVWRNSHAPTAEPVAQSDGMCNADNPARRCVCREEFGRRVCEPVAQGEAAQFPMTEQQVRQWIDACNHEPSRQVLRDYLRLREAQPRAVPDGWRETFAELLEDYAGARAETAVWNVTQRLQPEGGIRMPRPRLAKLMAHVDQLAATPSPGESNTADQEADR